MPEENKSKNGNGIVRYIGLLIAIAGGVYGAIAWVGRDVDVLRLTHNKEIKNIEERMVRELKAIEDRMVRVEGRVEGQILHLDKKLQIEVKQVETSATMQADRNESRLDDLEEWQKWWYRTIQPMDEAQNKSIQMLEETVFKRGK